MFTRFFLRLLIPSCVLLVPSILAEEPGNPSSSKIERFQTVEEVVAYIISVAPPQHLKTLKNYSRSKFLGMHFKLDDEFDQRLGLKDGNQALLDDADAKGHRRAWRTIRIALWEKLQRLE